MRKWYKFFIIILIISMFSGCNGYKGEVDKERAKFIEEIEETYKSIYDDDDRKVNNECGGFYYKYVSSRRESKEISQEFDAYYGAINYWYINAKEDGKIVLKYNYKFGDNEKYKLILCTPDKKIVKIFESTSQNSSKIGEKTIKIKKGQNRIMSVGYKASAKVDISIKIEGDIELKDLAKELRDNDINLC